MKGISYFLTPAFFPGFLPSPKVNQFEKKMTEEIATTYWLLYEVTDRCVSLSEWLVFPPTCLFRIAQTENRTSKKTLFFFAFQHFDYHVSVEHDEKHLQPNLEEIDLCWPKIWPHEYLISPTEISAIWPAWLQTFMDQANFNWFQWSQTIMNQFVLNLVRWGHTSEIYIHNVKAQELCLRILSHKPA